MFGFKKMFNRGASAAKKMENRDMLEATIAGAVLVAFAEGELEAEEVSALEKIVMNNEKLNHFGSEISATIDRFVELMKAGKTLGKVKVMKEIADCKNDEEEKMEIFATLIDIAQADGEVEPEEIEVLKEVGKTLGVSLSMFGLE